MQLLGFPLQLVGVLSLPWAYLKYVDEGDSIVDDLGSAAVSCLPSCMPARIEYLLHTYWQRAADH